MKRQVQNWTVEKLHQTRTQMSFPEYQRQPNLWSVEKRILLIDSILRDIDIPKLYFNQTTDKNFEVVDGQQRLWAIWEFIDDEYPYKIEGKAHRFSELSHAHREKIKNYALQVIIFQDAADEYLRELFLRLQLGLLLITGEKLHAASGEMKDFIFKKLSAHKFVDEIGIPNRRFAKETLCAQISLNSFNRAKLHLFARTRYEDLLHFFKEYEHPQGKDLELFRTQSKKVVTVLDRLWEWFGSRSKELKNRSYILSIYLFVEAFSAHNDFVTEKKKFVDFVFTLWKRLKEEVGSGIDRTNRELYAFETLLSSAPGEKYQIERRHEKLIEYYEHFKKTGKIKGD